MIIRDSLYPDLFEQFVSDSPILQGMVDAAEASPWCPRYVTFMTHPDHPDKAFRHHPDCKSRKCPACRPRRDLNDLTHFFDCWVPFEDRLHAVELSADEDPRSLKDAARRALVRYRIFRLDDGTAVAIVTGPMPNSRLFADRTHPVTLQEVMERVAGMLGRVADVREPISCSNEWYRTPDEPTGFTIVAGGPGKMSQAAIDDLVENGAEMVDETDGGRLLHLKIPGGPTALQQMLRRLTRLRFKLFSTYSTKEEEKTGAPHTGTDPPRLPPH